ncbi:MAG: lipopolysaccharide biosynthesis protein [Gemmataceae bacterium]
MSRTKKFVFGLGGKYVSQGVILVFGLWLTQFLLARLGDETYGSWIVLLQLVGVLSILDLGVIALVPREVAFRTGQETNDPDFQQLREFLNAVRRVTLWQVPVVGALGLFIAFVYWSGDSSEGIRLPLLVIVVTYVLLFPFRMYAAALEGMQDLFVSAAVVLIGWLVQAGVVLSLVLSGAGYWALVGGWFCNLLVTTLLCWGRLRWEFPQALPTKLVGSRSPLIGNLLSRGLWISLARIGPLLVFGTEMLIIKSILGPEAVVVYACTGKVVTLFRHQVVAIALTATPGISELKARSNRERLTEVSSMLSQALLLTSGLIAVVVLATNEGFVSWWVGQERFGGMLLTYFFVFAMVARHFTFTLTHLLFSLGHDRITAFVASIEGVVVFLGMIFLVQTVGFVGAPAALLVTTLCVTLPLNVFFLTKIGDIAVWQLLKAQVLFLMLFSVFVLMVMWLGTYWVPDTFLALASTSLGVALTYVVFMLPVLYRSPLRNKLPSKLAFFRL